MKTNHPRGRLPRARATLLSTLIALAIPCLAQADSVTDWNAIASSPLVSARFGAPPAQFRAIAITQIAVHDALNSIQPRYRAYNALPAAASGASADAAVAAAARSALVMMIEALPPAVLPGGAPNAAEMNARAAAIAFINARYDDAIGPSIDAA